MPVKNKCREFMKVCYILPYVIAFSISDILLNEPQDCQVSKRLWHRIFGSVTAGEIQSLVFTVTCLLVNVVSIRYGTAIGIFSVFILVMALETVGIMLFDQKLNVILNPFCFHSGIVNTPSVACMKIAIDFFYALIISVSCSERSGKAVRGSGIAGWDRYT